MSVFDERIENLRTQMKEAGIDYYMIPTADFHNSEYVHDYFKVREYMSGFTGSNGTLVVSMTNAGLWTDGRYFVQAAKELEGSSIELFRMLDAGVPTIEEFLLDNMQSGQVLGFDGRVVEAVYGRKLSKSLKAHGVSICYLEDLVDAFWTDRPKMPAGKLWIVPSEICGKSALEKIEEVRNKMADAGCKYHFISKLDDIMWLLNLRGNDVEYNPVALSYCFISKNECTFFVQKEAVSQEMFEYAKSQGITIYEYNDVFDFLKNYKFKKKDKLLVDFANISFYIYKELKKKVSLCYLDNPTELLKAIKNETELENIRKVYLQDSIALTRAIYWIKQNIGKIPMTEYSVAMKVDEFRRQIPGFIDLSFATICGYKENAAMMHYEATEDNCKELYPEGMLLIDSGGQYLGGTTDVTRTLALGPVSDFMKCHFTCVAMGTLRLSEGKFLYGCTGRNLDILAREPLWKMNIDYKCGTGHGIGYILNVHEGPQNIRWKFTDSLKEALIEEGMIISDEPGVYIEGSHGIRTENIIVAHNCEKNGDGQFMNFETLTYVPIDTELIDTGYMQREDIQNLNKYHRAVFEKISPFLNEEEKAWLFNVTNPVM